MLIEKKIPLEIENGDGKTLLGQALWSAINEHKDTHAQIIETLIESGAYVWPETLEWWNDWAVPSAETKARVAEILTQHTEFHKRLEIARKLVADTRTHNDNQALADELKELGNIERRPPFTRDAANKSYAEAADLYRELGKPLERRG